MSQYGINIDTQGYVAISGDCTTVGNPHDRIGSVGRQGICAMLQGFEKLRWEEMLEARVAWEEGQ